MIIHDWLVVSTPLKNMSSSVGMMKFPIYGNIIQMFQTTNQMISDFWDTSISRVPSVVIWLTLPDSTQKQGKKKHRRAVLHGTFVWKAFFENLKKSKKHRKTTLGIEISLGETLNPYQSAIFDHQPILFQVVTSQIYIYIISCSRSHRTNCGESSASSLREVGKVGIFCSVSREFSAYCNPRKMVLCF